jgi:hypothetical protein
MSSLIETINNTREDILSLHHGAALAELKDKIKNDPLKTHYYVYSGCISNDIANEISHRFNKGGIKTIVCKYGIISTQYYLSIDLSLPNDLKHTQETTTNLTI